MCHLLPARLASNSFVNLPANPWSTCTQIVFKRKTCLIEQSWCKCRKWNEELEEMWNGSWRRCMTSHDSRVWRPSRGRIRPMVGSGRLPWRGVYTFPCTLCALCTHAVHKSTTLERCLHFSVRIALLHTCPAERRRCSTLLYTTKSP